MSTYFPKLHSLSPPVQGLRRVRHSTVFFDVPGAALLGKDRICFDVSCEEASPHCCLPAYCLFGHCLHGSTGRVTCHYFTSLSWVVKHMANIYEASDDYVLPGHCFHQCFLCHCCPGHHLRVHKRCLQFRPVSISLSKFQQSSHCEPCRSLTSCGHFSDHFHAEGCVRLRCLVGRRPPEAVSVLLLWPMMTTSKRSQVQHCSNNISGQKV